MQSHPPAALLRRAALIVLLAGAPALLSACRTADAQTVKEPVASASSSARVSDKPPTARPARSASPSASRPAAAAPQSPPVKRRNSDTLRVSGRQILDTCGRPFVARGVETFINHQINVRGSMVRMVEEIAKTGSNSVRLLPAVDSVTVDEFDAVLDAAEKANLVVYISPMKREWFGRADVKRMLNQHKKHIIVDAFQEPDYDDQRRWKDDATSAIRYIRSQGYDVPITVLANNFGRDLPLLLRQGREVLAADSKRNTILGWQAYWKHQGWHEEHYGMSVSEGVARIAQQQHPIQIGIDRFADPGAVMNYQGAMRVAQDRGVSWLWWDFRNPFGDTNNLSRDGTAGNLTEVGREVIETHPAGIRKTARKACGR